MSMNNDTPDLFDEPAPADTATPPPPRRPASADS
jgi:hypothetical protein